MKTTHTIAVTYPLAGSEDGLPVEIRFTYEPHAKLDPGIDFQSAMPLCADRLPAIIRDAITEWAKGWLDEEEGYDRAWDKAVDDTERQRESARDMGMRA
jgi:hypothetical protein